MRECKHLGQEIALVEVLQVVDLVETALVLVRRVLNLIQNPLVVLKASPELAEIVRVVFKYGRIIGEINLTRAILQRNLRLLLEEVGRNV